MTKYGIDPTVICQIIDLANRHHIKTVILFGSRARGDFCRTSDIDLAVQGGDVCRFRLDVEEDTHTLLTFDVMPICQINDLANNLWINSVLCHHTNSFDKPSSSLTILVIISQNNYTTKRYIHKRKRKIVVETSAELHRI